MSIDFRVVRDNLWSLESAVNGGNFSDLLYTIADVTRDQGTMAKAFMYSAQAVKSMKEDPIVLECLMCLERIEASIPAAKEAINHPTKNQGALPGDLGDGTLLRMKLENLRTDTAMMRAILQG